MARQRSVSQRIAADRGVAGFFAFIASLVPFAGVLGMGYIAYKMITDQREDLAKEGGWFVLVILALFAFLFFVVARWTYDSVRSGLTPQRVQAMWLRRFQSEGDNAFRTSRIIDQLSRHGISALTLQDRDVQLSFEQRRNRLAPIFWLLFIPIGLLIGYAIWNGWQDARADIMDLPPAQDLRTGIGNVIGAFLGLIVVGVLLLVGFFLGIMATVVLVMILAALSGPIGAMLSRNRDDFRALPRLLKRLERGKRRGASVVRISDANWREAVGASLGAVDVAIIDLSNVTENIAWEIGEAVRACGPQSLVFISREGSRLSDAARNAVRTALGREPGAVVTYPTRRNANAERFARALRERIYAAADLRHAMKA